MTRTTITFLLALACAAALARDPDVYRTDSGHLHIWHYPDWCPEAQAQPPAKPRAPKASTQQQPSQDKRIAPSNPSWSCTAPTNGGRKP